MDVFPFFTGCQRSGTTLIKEIFRAHPRLAIPPESHFIPELLQRRHRYETRSGFALDRFVRDVTGHERFRRWRLVERDVADELRTQAPTTIPEAVRGLYRLYAARSEKPQYADKTPRYATVIPLIADAFPEARFVHAIRDGRDVALSLLETPWGPKRIERGALYWAERVNAARRAGAALPPSRYLEYRYEDLLADPASIVERICSFLDVGFDEQMLRYHEHLKPRKAPHFQHLHKPPTTVRDWRQSMAQRDLRVFEILAGDLLNDLGYERVTDGTTLNARHERAARRVAQRTRLRSRVKAARDSDHLGTRLAARAVGAAYARILQVRGSGGSRR